MSSYLFYRCYMHHEEFTYSSGAEKNNSTWKRNNLCSKAIRSKNIFCTHGTAILRINKILETRNPEIKEHLTKLQNQLFSIDHQKGELEKYVFEADVNKKAFMQNEMNLLIAAYEKICDEIEGLLTDSDCKEELDFEHC